jgi:hypothetical protein
MPVDPWATTDEVGVAWRPLQGGEVARAEYWLGAVQRALIGRWSDAPERLSVQALDLDRVKDVQIALVVDVLSGPVARGAKTWQQTSGSESVSVTLDTGRTEQFRLEPWMVAVFDGSAGTDGGPSGAFPAPTDWARLFPLWPESEAPL